MWPGDQQTVDGRCARMIPNLSPAWSTFTPITMPAQSWFASDHDQRGAGFSIMTSAAPAFSDHGQRGASFFRSRLARRRFSPITLGAAPVFSDHDWPGAGSFRPPLARRQFFPITADFPRPAVFRLRGRGGAFFPIATSAARVFSDHDGRGPARHAFFRSRPARHSVFPIATRAAPTLSDHA